MWLSVTFPFFFSFRLSSTDENHQTGLWGWVNDFKHKVKHVQTHLTIARALISAFPKRIRKDAIRFRCIGSYTPRVAQSRNALLGRNASCRNNCPRPSLGTQLKEIQMVCNLSSPLLLWRGQGVFDLGEPVGQWRVGHLHPRKHTNYITSCFSVQFKWVDQIRLKKTLIKDWTLLASLCSQRSALWETLQSCSLAVAHLSDWSHGRPNFSDLMIRCYYCGWSDCLDSYQ